ncbi:hypothetical protein ACWF94_08450 [Streptomyces sp. NPDC055078]
MTRGTSFEPTIGDVVRDAARMCVGRVVGARGGLILLWSLKGGTEWEAIPENLSPAAQSDAMSAAVAEVNAQSRWGL